MLSPRGRLPHVITVFSEEEFFFVVSSQESASSIRRAPRLFEEIHALRAPSVFLLNRSRECDRGKKCARSNLMEKRGRERKEEREREI